MWELRAGLLGLLVLSAACGASRSPAAGAAPEPNPVATGADLNRNDIGVQIDNQNFNDMNIYVVSRGERWLLGQATGLIKTALTIPGATAAASDRVRLLAEPIGGGRSITTPMLIVPSGQRIYWTIGSDPSTSTASTG